MINLENLSKLRPETPEIRKIWISSFFVKQKLQMASYPGYQIAYKKGFRSVIFEYISIEEQMPINSNKIKKKKFKLKNSDWLVFCK